MTDRTFRLLERYQWLDEHLRGAQANRFAGPFELLRLKKLQLTIKDRLAQLARPPLTSS